MVDVIVVGGGLAGLVAAAFAAKGGAGVVLLEGASAFGGRAKTRVVSGYRFNRGAHALYRDGFLDAALRKLGVHVSGDRPPVAGGYFVSGEKLHQAPFSAAGLAATTLLSDAEKGELASLLGRVIDGSTEIPAGSSLQDALAALTSLPKLRDVLATMVRLTSIVHAPAAADGRALLDQLHGALTRNARYVDGGWETMVDGLRSVAAGLGVELRPRARVVSLEQGPPWRATLGDGSALTTRALVLAVAPAEAAGLVPALAGRTAEAVPAEVACLDLGLAHLPRPEVLFALGVDRPLYFSVHSAAARLAPDGAALVHTMRYLEPGERPDRERLVAELEGFVDLLQPGWREQERARQFLLGMPAISSIPLAAKDGMNGRPDVAVAEAEGLFIAGDWVGPAGLLSDAAAASGRSAGEAAAVFARQ